MSHKKIILTSILSILILTGIYYTAANYGFFSGGTNAPSVPEDTMTRGLVGYWEFDEGTGQTAYDISGNSNDGTLGADANAGSDDPTWTADGKNAGGMEFDGVDDYVNAGSGSSLDITSDITIDTWIKPNTVVPEYQWIAGRGISNTNRYDLFLNYDEIRFAVNTTTGYRTTTTANISTSSWSHIVVTFSDTTNTVKFYVNGQLNLTFTDFTDVPVTNNGNFFIGRFWSSNSYQFNGSIDSVRIYNRALTADEVRYHYNRGGPVGYWSFDEGSGLTAFDSTENNNDGTLKSSALDFDGVNDYVDAGDIDVFDSTTEFSCGMWFYATTRTNTVGQILLRKYYDDEISSQNNVDIQLLRQDHATHPNEYMFTASTGVGTQITLYSESSYQFPLNTWTHLYVARNATNMYIYENGIEIATGDISGASPESTDIVSLGAAYYEGSGVNCLNGLIDEVRIYDTALSAEEIARHYNGDFSQDPTANLVLLQHFEEGMACDVNGEVDCLTDDSGSGNDGTLYSFDNLTVYDNGVDGWITDVKKPGWRWVNGKYKTAGEFNGRDDYVDMGMQSFGSSVGSNSITTSSWIKTNETGRMAILGTANDETETIWNPITINQDALSAQSTGRIYVYIRGQSGATDRLYGAVDYNTGIIDGNWHHIVSVTDGDSSIEVYVDGVSQTVTIQDSGLTNTENFDYSVLVGASNGRGIPEKFFNGSIDDVRIYNYARSADEIRLDYNAGVATHLGPSEKDCDEDPAGCMDYGLVGSWGMDEGTGLTAYDSSDNSNNGTLEGGPKWTTDSSPSAGGGGSLSFDGVDDYVDCGIDANCSGAGTLMVWVKADSWPGIVGIASKGNSGNGNSISYGIWGFSTGKPKGYVANGAAFDSIEFNTVVTTGIWHQLAYTWDGTNLTTYLDGAFDKQESQDVVQSLNTQKLLFGAVYTGDWFFDGSIDNVRIYNRVLSEEEIRYHYNKGGPVAEWKFDEGSGTTIHDSSGNLHHGTLTP